MTDLCERKNRQIMKEKKENNKVRKNRKTENISHVWSLEARSGCGWKAKNKEAM
jgi:hypothetical protein